MSAVGGEFANADTERGADVGDEHANIHEIRRRVATHDTVLFHHEHGIVPNLKSLRASVQWFHYTMASILTVIAITLICMAVKNG